MKQLIVEDIDACAVVSYEYRSPKGTTLHQDEAEVWKVADGKIDTLTIAFDIPEFRRFRALKEKQRQGQSTQFIW